MQPASAQFLSALVGQAPLLVVYLGALVAAIVWWGRHPRPAVFVLVASLLLLGTTLTWPLAQAWVMTQATTGGTTSATFGQRIMVLSVLLSIVRAVAYALLVVAAFVGRRAEEHASGFPVTRVATQSPPPLYR